MIFHPLNQQQIRQHLLTDKKMLTFHLPVSAASTNDLAQEQLFQYPEQLHLVATNKQTAGRGRQGRVFYSSLQHGLYFSLAFMPNTKNMAEIPLYTLLAAAALVDVLEETATNPLSIKWVNDIFFEGKKIGGILSELISAKQKFVPAGVVVGIGLNLAGDFSQASPDVQKVAGTLFGKNLPLSFNQNAFLGAYLTQFCHYHQNFSKKDFLTTYKRHLMGVGKTVSYQVEGERRTGVIQGINKKGQLLIKKQNQIIETLYGQDIHFSSSQFTEDP